MWVYEDYIAQSRSKHGNIYLCVLSSIIGRNLPTCLSNQCLVSVKEFSMGLIFSVSHVEQQQTILRNNVVD